MISNLGTIVLQALLRQCCGHMEPGLSSAQVPSSRPCKVYKGTGLTKTGQSGELLQSLCCNASHVQVEKHV